MASLIRSGRVALGRILPDATHTRLKYLTRWPRPRWGSLRRLTPVSPYLGADRGTPIDRVYIEAFLGAHAETVRGAVLEVKDSRYTRSFGGDRVRTAEVVDIDPGNTRATLVADLGTAGSLPEERFDCFILTQTLQLVPDLTAALRNSWQALRPGGTMLLTVPAVSRTLGSIDRWRFTPQGLDYLLRRTLGDAGVRVTGYGNLLSTVAFLQGLAAEELTVAELAPHDEHYPLVVGARVDKGSADGP